MSTPSVVNAFYERIWNMGDLAVVPELLTQDFSFRGSLGVDLRARDELSRYVASIRLALAEYRCTILACVTEGNQAFAQILFSGQHVGDFLGYQPTGKPLRWHGAALFRFEENAISRLWVLGDLAGLEALLKWNEAV